MVEFLSVFAIIGVLGAILIPVAGRVRKSARNAECVGNLRQIFNAANLWAQNNRGSMPDSRWWQGPANDPFTADYSIAPYLDLGEAHETAALTTLTCPSARSIEPSQWSFGRTYSMNQYAGGSFNKVRQDLVRSPPSMLAVFMDGALMPGSGQYFSYTTEAHMAAGASPSAQFPHDDRMNIVYGDGHVAVITRSHAQKRLTENRLRVPFWGGDQPSLITD